MSREGSERGRERGGRGRERREIATNAFDMEFIIQGWLRLAGVVINCDNYAVNTQHSEKLLEAFVHKILA